MLTADVCANIFYAQAAKCISVVIILCASYFQLSAVFSEVCASVEGDLTSVA